MPAILPKIVKEKDSRLLYILCIIEKRSVCEFRLTQGRNRLRNRIEAGPAISAFALAGTTVGGYC